MIGFAIVNKERLVSMSDDCIHDPLRISPTLCASLMSCPPTLSAAIEPPLPPRKVYHRRPLDGMEIKATNWTIPQVSLTSFT